jgi:hypothetical protein
MNILGAAVCIVSPVNRGKHLACRLEWMSRVGRHAPIRMRLCDIGKQNIQCLLSCSVLGCAMCSGMTAAVLLTIQ